jgi:hypothetical protein
MCNFRLLTFFINRVFCKCKATTFGLFNFILNLKTMSLRIFGQKIVHLPAKPADFSKRFPRNNIHNIPPFLNIFKKQPAKI